MRDYRDELEKNNFNVNYFNLDERTDSKNYTDFFITFLIERKIENTINTFRAVFSCLDNKDYDFLESKTILVGYPDWENPFDIFFLKSR